MNLKTKVVNPLLLLITSVLFLGVGVFILIDYDWAFRVFMAGIAVAVAVAGIAHSAGIFLKEQFWQGILFGFAYAAVAAGLFVLSWFSVIPVAWIFGLWFLCTGMIRGVICIYAVLNRSEGRLIGAVVCVLSVGFAVALFVNPFMQNTAVLRMVGIYMILYGVAVLFDFFSELFRWSLGRENTLRRFRIPLPLFITAFIPSRLMTGFHKYFKEHHVKETVIQQLNAPLGKQRVDLEIFIHLCGEHFNEFGHTDFCFGDTVYSYGAYDETEHKCFGMFSRGTVVTAPRQPYIHHCLSFEKKILVGFGLCLSPAQQQTVRNKISEILQTAQPWQTAYEQRQNGMLPQTAVCEDAASELVKATGAKIYKIQSGKFKTYFSINTNCVKLADYMTGSAGLDVLDVSGIVTPGSYYALLNDMFERGDTIVMAKTIYRN